MVLLSADSTTVLTRHTLLFVSDQIDGGWAEWDPWSQCTATCGGGIQHRTRNCSDPAPQNGGAKCSGNATEIRPCSEWMCSSKTGLLLVEIRIFVFTPSVMREEFMSFLFQSDTDIFPALINKINFRYARSKSTITRNCSITANNLSFE